MEKQNTPIMVQILTDLGNITRLVNTFFKNREKTIIWLNSNNKLLGNQQPIEMIFKGRTKKLKTFIEQHLKGNSP